MELCKVVYKYVGDSTERILDDLNDKLKQNLLNSFKSIQVCKEDAESKNFAFNPNVNIEEEEQDSTNENLDEK